jgi:hypothetical protein
MEAEIHLSVMQNCLVGGSPVCTCNCPMLSQSKTTVHYQAAKLFTKTMAALQRELGLNSAFEKANRLLEQKRTGRPFHQIAPITL